MGGGVQGFVQVVPGGGAELLGTQALRLQAPVCFGASLGEEGDQALQGGLGAVAQTQGFLGFAEGVGHGVGDVRLDGIIGLKLLEGAGEPGLPGGAESVDASNVEASDEVVETLRCLKCGAAHKWRIGEGGVGRAARVGEM